MERPYEVLDRPEVLSVLFYPRRDVGVPQITPGVHTVRIPVAPGVAVGGKIFLGDWIWHFNRGWLDQRSVWHNHRGKSLVVMLFGDGHAAAYRFPTKPENDPYWRVTPKKWPSPHSSQLSSSTSLVSRPVPGRESSSVLAF